MKNPLGQKLKNLEYEVIESKDIRITLFDGDNAFFWIYCKRSIIGSINDITYTIKLKK